jgi:predicted benzoate:H+ symporter BenE
MSRGPQVLDMEYREPDRLSMALEGPSFLPFSTSTLSAAATSITIGLVLCQRWFLLHEVMSPGIMVCVTLILKTFEYVHLIPFVSNKCLDLILVHLTMSGGNDRMP